MVAATIVIAVDKRTVISGVWLGLKGLDTPRTLVVLAVCHYRR